MLKKTNYKDQILIRIQNENSLEVVFLNMYFENRGF